VQRGNPRYPPSIDERDVVEFVGNGASCISSVGRIRSLVAVVETGGKCAVLDCDVPVSRFEEFRSLFVYVARSLRVGDEAKHGVGEEITVAVSEL
jgi:hypothetical protein